ncbi:MAG: thiamine-phosphate kinase [Candidatus Aminicenantales bacterium]
MKLKLSAIGEFGLIRRFSPAFSKDLPPGVVGIGDDAAVLPWKKDACLLVTTDMLIENVHFLRSEIGPRDLGVKALAVNLSDIAAMGGSPRSAFLSLGIPGKIDVEWLDAFFRGMAEQAKASGVRLLGGDTTQSPGPIVINVVVLGRVRRTRLKLRSGARTGDIIGVTGFLGDSGAGLRVLLDDLPRGKDEAHLIRRHHRPRAHLAEGAWLAARDDVTAMMDVSDGIDSDLRRIMERSHCGAVVDLDDLPLSGPLRRAGKKYGWDVRGLAAAGGEDYCLLATIRPDRYERITAGFERKFGRPLSRIGRIEGKKEGLRYRAAGKTVELKRRGFDHFR